MSRDRAALLRAICVDPADDFPRLAYADLCEEDGDPDRAAFIRDQLRIAKQPLAEHDPYHRRFRPMLISVGPKIAPPGFDTILSKKWFDLARSRGVCFWRGFVRLAACPSWVWFDDAEMICAAHPVERVVLGDKSPDRWQGEYSWHCDGDVDESGLPIEFFPLLHTHPKARVPDIHQVTFNFRDDALEALCVAAVNLGRDRAGLPRLPHNPSTARLSAASSTTA